MALGLTVLVAVLVATVVIAVLGVLIDRAAERHEQGEGR
jgi:hypothetical protein